MRRDPIHLFRMNEGEQPITPQGVPPSSSPVSSTRESVLSTLRVSELTEQCLRELNAYRRGGSSTDIYGVELLRRAAVQGDQEAWAALQLCLTEVVHGWLRSHPSREVASRLDSEENYVAQAYARFWQATSREQQVEFRTLAAALRYLRASLNSVILDAIRAYLRPKEIALPEPGASGEPFGEDGGEDDELWEVIRSLLPHPQEQRLAYLLFHCGLKPREIVHFCPREFSSVEEVYYLRSTIFERLLRHADALVRESAGRVLFHPGPQRSMGSATHRMSPG